MGVSTALLIAGEYLTHSFVLLIKVVLGARFAIALGTWEVGES
jgi:hypothetical protein